MNCAICYDRDMAVVLDLGDQALAGAFLKPSGFEAEKRYPLRVGFCRNCFAVQVIDRVAPDDLFGNYFYRSSTSAEARAHFVRYAADVVERFAPRTVIEVGCNDGAMLQPLAECVEKVIGVDPSRATAECHVPRVSIWRSYFTEQVARQIGRSDVVVANNVFAHVENIHEFIKGVRATLNPDGVFVFECHYLGSVLEGQYDAIYHEHVFYHSLISLQRLMTMWGMQVFDVEPIARHGGSMRFYACKNRGRPIEERVSALAQQEIDLGFHLEDTYKQLAVRMLDHRRGLYGLLSRLKRERSTVAAYGAAGRANTLLQWVGAESISYVVDDCEAKHGYHTPGTHIEVRPPSALDRDPPDYVLVTAWTYLEEIATKCRGLPLIVPFPEARILAGEVLEAA